MHGSGRDDDRLAGSDDPLFAVDDEAHVTVEMILQNLQKNAAQAQEIVVQTLPLIPNKPNWPCHHALQNAILTDKKVWPPKTKLALGPLLENYL